MNTQKLEQVPIDKLVPYARNARTHSKEQIAQLRASLREFGFVSPAVIDADYNILVGHGRITAAREEGYETVPCVFAENLTEAQKRAYILADNQLALNAGWDEEMLKVELEALNARLSEKQKELVRLAQAKKDYTVLADEIDKLNEKKQQLLVDKAENEGLKKRIRELETFLKEADQELTEYDETMVRKYIREIKVYEDHLLVCFEAGIEVEIDR